MSGEEVSLHLQLFCWDDLIRKHWPRKEWHLAWPTLLCYLDLFRSGLVGKFRRTSWPPTVTLLYPALFLAGVFLAVFAIVAAVVWLGLSREFAWWLVVPSGVLAGWIVLTLSRFLERRLHCYWLLRSYLFMWNLRRGRVPELTSRIDEIAAELHRAHREGEEEEILLVGHSLGSTLAVSTMAAFIRKAPDLTKGPRVGLLMLADCLPLTSFHPDAVAFRDDMRTVAEESGVEWIDFSAWPDGASFAMIDTVKASGIHLPPDVPLPRPSIIPARFVKMFPRSRYEKLKRDKLGLHFLYLAAPEEPGSEYDFYEIIGGDLTLEHRYANSESRLRKGHS